MSKRLTAKNGTIAQTQKAVLKEDGETWNLSFHLEWYYHCKRRGPDYFHKRWGNHKAIPSRNKREGKYLPHGKWLQHGLAQIGVKSGAVRAGPGK